MVNADFGLRFGVHSLTHKPFHRVMLANCRKITRATKYTDVLFIQSIALFTSKMPFVRHISTKILVNIWIKWKFSLCCRHCVWKHGRVRPCMWTYTVYILVDIFILWETLWAVALNPTTYKQLKLNYWTISLTCKQRWENVSSALKTLWHHLTSLPSDHVDAHT